MNQILQICDLWEKILCDPCG